jgi:hypothetical protein
VDQPTQPVRHDASEAAKRIQAARRNLECAAVGTLPAGPVLANVDALLEDALTYIGADA